MSSGSALRKCNVCLGSCIFLDVCNVTFMAKCPLFVKLSQVLNLQDVLCLASRKGMALLKAAYRAFLVKFSYMDHYIPLQVTGIIVK